MRPLRALVSASIVLLGACGLTVVGTGPLDGDAGLADASTTGDATDEARGPKPSPDVDATPDGAVVDAATSSDADADASEPPVLRFNVGGPTYVGAGDFPGTWVGNAPDAGPCFGNLKANAVAIRGTTDDVLFQTELWEDPLVCRVGAGKLPPGRYRVRLLFAEIYFGSGCPGGGGNGSRVFDIQLEGQTVAQGIDLHRLVGCAANTSGNDAGPLERVFEVDVTDGTLDVRMPASRNNAKLSALEVRGPLGP